MVNGWQIGDSGKVPGGVRSHDGWAEVGVIWQSILEDLIRFASQPAWQEQLAAAKVDYLASTGELFESDHHFEQRIGAFLQWYVLDRIAQDGATPVWRYIAEQMATWQGASWTLPKRVEALSRADPSARLACLLALAQSRLSLYQFQRLDVGCYVIKDLLSAKQWGVQERRRIVGLQVGDVVEARLVIFPASVAFAEGMGFLPREAVAIVQKAARQFVRRAHSEQDRIAFVHRISFLMNRCERYKHVPVTQIFAQLCSP